MSLHFEGFKDFAAAQAFAIDMRDATNLATKVWRSIEGYEAAGHYVTVQRAENEVQEEIAIRLAEHFGGKYTGT